MSGQHEPLEYGLVADIPRTRAAYWEFLRFHWDFYSELAFLRKQIYYALKSSLAERATPFQFSKWQRAVKYQYALSPLSAAGSMADPGGRFNVGAIDPARFPMFPALYLASDKRTALAEILGRAGELEGLSPEELALTRPDSVAVVSASGVLESALDIRQQENLAGFVNLIKDFKLSAATIRRARRFGAASPQLIGTTRELSDNLTTSAWRVWPMQCDVPAAPQIFGRIAMDAGVEGIIYTSVLTQKACIAIYPQNFADSTASIELDDPPPSDAVPRRIDASSFEDFL